MMRYTKKMNFGYDSSIWTLYGYFGSDANQQAKEASNVKYQNYNMDLVRTVYDELVSMAPKSPDFALKKALEPWIHKNSENIPKMLNLCARAKDEESAKRCWTFIESDVKQKASGEKYERYNMDIVTTVYNGLVAMAPGSPEFALKEAFEPWVQKETIESISKKLRLCKNAKNEESAKRRWSLEANKKKSDL
jgi:hypothetical protein